MDDIEQILSTDESVLLKIKPNKVRFTLIGNIAGTLFISFIGAIFLTIGILMLVNIIPSEDGANNAGIPFVIFGSIPIIFAIKGFIQVFVRYKNIYYIVTNKRLIIRSGLIGIDYKEMSLLSIESMTVRVDFLDKLVKPNTGTIFFASASNPMMKDSNGRTIAFRFEDINDPYETYKKIKEIKDNEEFK